MLMFHKLCRRLLYFRLTLLVRSLEPVRLPCLQYLFDFWVMCAWFFDKMFNDLNFMCHCSVFVYFRILLRTRGFFNLVICYRTCLSGRSTVHWPITCIIHASLMHESVYKRTRWSVTIAPRLFMTFPVTCLVPSYAIPGEMSHNRSKLS